MILFRGAAFLLLWSLIEFSSGTVTFQNNGYGNVVVSISPDISQDVGQSIIDGIKEWITQGSKKLFTATKKYAFIAEVKILIPHTWKDIADVQASNGVIYEDGAIRIENPNPLYGDAPYTVQQGGCGERGEKIMVTQNYLTQLDLTTNYYGPPENIFVHEWAKLRYGVFEEHGYPGDLRYPLFYQNFSLINGVPVPELVPNFCTNSPIQGHMEDKLSGGDCVTDEDSFLPNANCLFIPDGDNTAVKSSFMAAPFLSSAEFFCGSGTAESQHDHTSLMNKQKDLCSGRSTWSVIEANEDFANIIASTLDEAPPTVFSVVRNEDEGQFVMVLDVSGSMAGDKMEKLKQSTIRWTENDIRDGSYLGVTSFDDHTYENVPMIEVNAASRLVIMDALSRLRPGGSTCLGDGVRQGLRTLSATTSSGGVMILFTDGMINCGVQLDDPQFIQEIVDFKVRICTIAFGEQADEGLESLATISNGKTFTVFDNTNLDDINTALQGCMAFQPSLSTNETDITVFSKQYANLQNNDGSKSDEFIIDRTVGSDVKIQIDYRNPSNIREVRVTGPNSYNQVFTFQQNPSNVFVIILGTLAEGTYRISIVTTSTLSYAMAVITSKPKEGGVLPFTMNCWASTGTSDVDLTVTRLAIVAQVTQGNSPVMDAKVEVIIEKEGQANPIVFELLDNGRGADLMSNDGRYSQYFTNYDNGDGRYIIKCQVQGSNGTNINGGTDSRRRYISKSYPLEPALPPPCCGSNTVNENTVKEPTGEFFREASGGSVKIVNIPSPGADNFPPIRVVDFTANVVNETIVISFTSPGDDFDAGKASHYDIRISEDINSIFHDFENAGVLNQSLILAGYDLDTVEGGSRKQVVFDYNPLLSGKRIYIAVKTYDEAGNAGDISNVAEFLLNERPWTKVMIVSGWPSAVAYDVEVIDLSSTTKDCTKPAAFPGAERGSVGTHIVGQSIVCGGYLSDACYYYERSSNAWVQGQHMAERRYMPAAVNMDKSTWWVTGGQSIEGPARNTTETYTIAQGWNSYVDLPRPVYNHCLIKLNDTHYMLVGGAYDGEQTWIFDSRTETWRRMADASLARSLATCGMAIKRNGEIDIVLAGGKVGGGFEASTELFSMRTLTWRQGPTFPRPMDLAFGVQYGGTVLAVGGYDGTHAYDTILQYDPNGARWVELDQKLETARGVYTAFLGPDDAVNC